MVVRLHTTNGAPVKTGAPSILGQGTNGWAFTFYQSESNLTIMRKQRNRSDSVYRHYSLNHVPAALRAKLDHKIKDI